MTSDFRHLDELYPLPPEDLPRQWVLGEDESALPQGWPRRSLNGWHLASHPEARVCDLRDTAGRCLGWILHAVVAFRHGDPLSLLDGAALELEATTTVQALEADLYGRSADGSGAGAGGATRVEGPWTAIVLNHRGIGPRVYVAAAQSAVYSPVRRMVAASHNLIPGLTRDRGLSAACDPLALSGYYTFGLTAFENLRRLMPNHFLDLNTFEARRHWPRQALRPLGDGPTGAAAVVDQGRTLITALLEQASGFHVSLSAGRDSRAVLAMLRPVVEKGAARVTLGTTYGSDVESRTDRQAAQRLAAICGLPLSLRQRKPHQPDLDTAQRMFVRTGEAFGGPILSAPRLRRAVQDNPPAPDAARTHLAGMGGETGRAFYWSRTDLDLARVTPELLAARLKSPATDTVLQAAQHWLDGLPDPIRDSAADVLDLAYVEQRLGCWQAPALYLFPGQTLSVNLMLSAASIETMLRLPVEYRLSGALQRDMVAHGWPALLKVPFNEATGGLALLKRGLRLRRRLRGVASRVLR